jgi:ComF family protein
MNVHLQAIGNGLVDLIYPRVCLVCGEDLDGGVLCAFCELQFKPINPPFCDRCGEPISVGRIVCKRCESGPGPAYDWSQAAYQYDGALLRAIHRFKYDGKSALAERLGVLLARSMDARTPLINAERDSGLPEFDMVVPVPLHPGRLRRRGFNQAERIALVLARERSLLMVSNGVRRVRRTPTQTARSLEMRTENVRRAFHIPNPDLFVRKSVLIVDDVLTSTSTVREVARVIAEAGASRVCVIALAQSV